MSRYRAIRAALATTVLLIAVAVWGVGRIQASADSDATHAINAGQRMLIAMLDQETGLRGFINTRTDSFLQPYRDGRVNFESAVAEAKRYATDNRDRVLLAQQISVEREWQDLADHEIDEVRLGVHTPISAAVSRKAVMDAFRRINTAYIADKTHDRGNDRRVASIVSVGVILLAGLIFGVLSWLVFERPARADARRRRRFAQFGDALQATRGEREAFDVLKRHLESWFTQARAVAMVTNSSQNRLEAATSLERTPMVAEGLKEAAPDTCLAIRLAKPYQRRPGAQELMICDICGKVPEPTACVPTVVGGEVVGSVVLGRPEPLARAELEDLVTSVGTAGPVIANLRNLALAQRRASTDALTGLANQRSIGDTLNRMVAQASRSKIPLTAIMFDLDHFKSVNDIHGHAKGDEVLATVAQVVQANVRESDFLGRYGGEEFVALLPDTSRPGGAQLAEKLRAAICEIEIPDLDRRLSASFGVAALPGDAVNGEALLRAADRALYVAKNNGRNRVEVVSSAEARREPTESR